MVFKQGVLKEEKIKLIIVSICIFVPLIALIVLAVLEGANLEMLLVFVVLFCFPIFLLMLFFGLKNLEWYHILLRRHALHVDFCPISAKTWGGKAYANVMDDCTDCKYCFLFNQEKLFYAQENSAFPI